LPAKRDGDVMNACVAYRSAMADTQIQRFNPVLRYDDGEKTIFDLGPCVVYVVLDNEQAIDTMHARAASARAEILMEPQDQDYGSRDFSARDPEGFVWAFGTYRPGT
jgi:uncharacterized glyoxalase superfamily protein PhnB